MVTKVKEDRMATTSELKPLLKHLRLGYLLNTLPERLALARRDQLDHAAFLRIIIGDEVTGVITATWKSTSMRRASRRSAAWSTSTGPPR